LRKAPKPNKNSSARLSCRFRVISQFCCRGFGFSLCSKCCLRGNG
jgi:hypothetical protein